MNSPPKFLFEARFDGGAPPPPRVRRHFSADEVESSRKAAEKAGAEAGRAQALREVEARAAAALEVLAREIGGAMADIRAAHEAAMREHLATATEIVRRLFWENETQTDIAADFGVSKMAISKTMARIARQGRVALADHEHLALLN